MSESPEYVLGESEKAARRLELQDTHFGSVSEQFLDDLQLRPDDRVVELGCGPGMFSQRVLRRLGPGGVLVGVDTSEGLLAQACAKLAGMGPARFEPVLADIAQPGAWLHEAHVLVGRTVLHHVPMVELLLGKLRTALRPGTRVGFIEPDFRTPLGRLAYLEATGRPKLAPLRIWAIAINQLYQHNRLSPEIGATMAQTMQMAGYSHIHSAWSECRSDQLMIENMLMFYDEVRDRLVSAGILTAVEISRQQELLRALKPESLPPAWGSYRLTCVA